MVLRVISKLLEIYLLYERENMNKEKFTNANKIDEILEKYQKMSSEERLGLLNDLMNITHFPVSFTEVLT